MKTYLVGGAVRDALLGRTAGDRDYVVVGATPDKMLSLGFQPVGKDFPVFLHPESKEEYALARSERKTAAGYHGFVFHTDADVTLEQDLIRRDFTVNAIAQDENGTLFDPFNGRQDIQNKILRHVSPAFAEDPVRILRAARFMARFAELGFSIASETIELMRLMVANGEVDALVPERVWQELKRALEEPRPSAFIQTLHDCGALEILFPEIDALFGIPQRIEFHPEVDAGLHTQMVCDMAAQLAPRNALIGFAALTHDLGKALSPKEDLPKHIGHEKSGLKPLTELCERFKVPVDYRDLALIVCREHLNIHRLDEMKASTVHDLIARCDGFRKPERIDQLGLVCEADKRGRLGLQNTAYPSRALLNKLHAAAMSVNFKDIDSTGLQGPQINEAMRRARIKAVAGAM
ncbi:MAG: multifunctional CCA addition/repair protein [Arenimonas sp.]